VFTPKGDIKTITQGATALDFAFSMHTDLGQHCLGAKVNHKLVPLNYQLESGDQVEILTSQNQHPEKEWFNYVVTTHAKKCITEYFKQQDRALADNGRQMLSEALKTEERQLTPAVINRLMHHFSITRPNELMRQIGLGALPIEQVMQATHPQQDSFFKRIMKTLTGGSTSETDAEELAPTVSQIPSARPTNPKHVMLTEEDFGHCYRLAQCCSPIPGDDVMGALEDDGSIVVHKRSCPNAMQIKSLHGDTIVDTVWATHRIRTFAETIEIKGVDKMSILLNVINIISERYQINIKEINITSKDGMFTGRITIYVHDLSDISKLCEQLLTIPEVNTVGRIEKYQTK
ncbi:MAG: bifunctional (p)ppGpp synthetase/guanosine-3',5'-bis(diphosphate) 3'-pyrophosphohydrolase, partial [Paludibacteraceae bacterium]|nr:bifunctional (p)ppGpp synthetase/guanosine-3',5'-bis(diphosphate) 3'-pyrophosphohydrolase [Paludibacteraceae bacterium]